MHRKLQAHVFLHYVAYMAHSSIRWPESALSRADLQWTKVPAHCHSVQTGICRPGTSACQPCASSGQCGRCRHSVQAPPLLVHRQNASPTGQNAQMEHNPVCAMLQRLPASQRWSGKTSADPDCQHVMEGTSHLMRAYNSEWQTLLAGHEQRLVAALKLLIKRLLLCYRQHWVSTFAKEAWTHDVLARHVRV